MKTLIVVIVLTFPSLVFGQLTLKSQTVTHPDSSVLFVGVDNCLIIEGVKKQDDLRLMTSKASVQRINNNEFIVRVSDTGEIPFEIYNYNKPKQRLLLSKVFRSETIPTPEARLGNATDTILSVNEVLVNPYLNVVIPQSSYRHKYAIVRFVLTIKKTGGDILVHAENTPGNRLTNAQIEIIKDLTADDKMIFSKMVVSCPDCRNFKLKPYQIIIK